MSRSRLFFYFLLSFLAGIALHSLYFSPWAWLWPLVGGLAIGATVALVRTKWIWVGLFLILGLALGLYQFQSASQKLERHFRDSEIIVRVRSEVSAGPKSAQFLGSGVDGRVWVIAPDQIILHYGDLLRLECNFKKIEPTDERAGWYFAKGVGTICFPKSIRLVSLGHSSLEKLWAVRNRAMNLIDQTFSLTDGALLGGMLFGGNFLNVKDLSEHFKAVGLTHLVAISGYNFSLLAFFIASLLELFYLPRRLVTLGTLLILLTFLFFVGPSASALRALLMAALTLLGKVFGRARRITHTFVLTAAVLLFINPMSLRFDAGFDLSFAATGTLIYLVPWLSKKLSMWLRLESIKEKFLFWKQQDIIQTFFENILASTAIMIITAPILWYFFKRVSLVSVLANVLVGPMVPVIMIGGYLLVIFGLIYYPLGAMLGWALEPALRYIILIANFLS